MRKCILVVDDSVINRSMLRKILGDGYTVLEAENGKEAIAILRTEAENISVILLDLLMPVMNGYQMLSYLQKNNRYSCIPVIVTTGDTEQDIEIRVLTQGAVDFIMKPYQPAIIKQRVNNVIKLRETASIAKLVLHDELTGLYSRRGFFDKAGELLARHDSGYYVLTCFNIDHFKMINDQYGNEKGDEVLCSIAHIKKDTIESLGGIVCRVAADQFAALYPSRYVNAPEIQRMRKSCAVLDDTIPELPISIGVYHIDDMTLELSAMYDRALLAQAVIKGGYDIRVNVYDEEMREQLVREQSIVNSMKRALEEQEFEIWLQPQYDYYHNSLCGAEALVRWRQPQNHQVLSPGEFIPLFEKNGFIYELDKYVWEQACKLQRKWIDMGISPLKVSVNISRYDIYRDDLIEVILGLTQQYDIEKELLCLEITESAFSEVPEKVISVVRQFSELGFIIEIDDFGTGYSSLNTLKDVPAKVLKLDMRFLDDTSNTKRGSIIIESVLHMAKQLGMMVIAEGVETTAQADFLKSVGCRCMQGYLYAKPMPVNDYEKLLYDHGKSSATTCRNDQTIRIENCEEACNLFMKADEIVPKDKFCNHQMERIPCGIGVFEYQRDQEVKQIYLNEGYYDMFGMSKDEAFMADEHSVLHALHTEDRDGFFQELEACMKEQRIGNYDGRIAFYNKRYHWVNMRMRIAYQTFDSSLLYIAFGDIDSMKFCQYQTEANRRALEAASLNGGVFFWKYDFIQRKTMNIFCDGSCFPHDTDTKHKEQEFVLAEILHEQDVGEYQRMLRELVDGAESSCCEVRLLSDSTGQYEWHQVNYTRIKDSYSNAQYALGFAKNIQLNQKVTKQYEDELKLKHELVKDAESYFQLNITHELIEEYYSRSSPDMSITKPTPTNQRFRDHLLESILPEDHELLIHSVFIEAIKNKYQQGNHAYMQDVRTCTKDNQRGWLRIKVTMIQRPNTNDIIAFVYSRDITKQKKEELAINSVLKNEVDTVALLNVKTGNSYFIIQNTSFFEHLIGQEFCHDDYIHRIHEAGIILEEERMSTQSFFMLNNLIAALDTKPRVKQMYSILDDKKLSRKMVTVFYLDESQEDIVLATNDITTVFHEAEYNKHILQSAYEDLKKANQAKTDFLAKMSHDMRTPMNGIIGLTHLTQEIEGLPEQARNNLSAIYDSSQFLLILLNDVLDMSMIDHNKMVLNKEVVHAGLLLQNIIAAINPLLEKKRVRLVVDQHNAELEYVRVDPQRIQQIIINVISNAIKFSNEGSTVRLVIEALKRVGTISTTRVTVEDEGIGMSKEFLPYLFEPFQQEIQQDATNQGGTGLGMAIVKNLVEQMGGKIEVESKKNVGTKVAVTLDFERVYHHQESEHDATTKKEKLKGKRVLLVEDNNLNAMIASKLLEKQGMLVERAGDGADGLRCFEKSSPYYYDLIVMDIRMPIMNGLEATRAIRGLVREDAKRVPIIAMTANSFQEDYQNYLKAGMNDLLPKPIEPSHTFQLLAKYLTS